MELDFNLVVILIIVIGIGVLSLTIRNLRIRLRDSIHLAIAAISALLFSNLFLIMLYFNWQGNYELFLLFQKLAMLPFSVIFIAGYFYYESFIDVKPPIYRMSIFLVAYAIITSFNIINVFEFIDSIQFHNLTITLNAFYSASVNFFAFFTYKRILKLWNRLMIKIDLFSLFVVGISALCVGIAFLLEFLGIVTNLSFPQLIFLGIAVVLMIIGIGSLAINNLKWGDYIYYIPIPIHIIMVYSKGGLLAYSRAVTTKSSGIFKKNEHLVSGGFTGFSNFFNEILGSKAELSYINATAYEFLFKSLPDDKGTAVIITSGNNYFLNKSLTRFVSAMNEDLLKEIQECRDLDKITENTDKIVMKTFPYLVIDKSQDLREEMDASCN